MPSSKTTKRSECPVGHDPVTFNDSLDCPAVEGVVSEGDSSSLWLIKVPHNYDVSSLSGQEVVLNGSQDLPSVVSKNKDKKYEVQSRTNYSAELSSFSVLLPSAQKKSLCAASSIIGQMSVIQSVSVPPSTLPESSDSLTVQRQSQTKYIKKWEPFGCREPKRTSTEKKTEEPRDNTDGARKQRRDRKEGNLEKTFIMVNKNTSMKNDKSDATKKTDKNTERVEFDMTRVKIEPRLDSDSEVTSRNGDQSSRSGRKRKSAVNDSGKRDGSEGENGVSPTKKKKEAVQAVKVKREFGSPERSPKLSRKERESFANISGANFGNEEHHDFDLARVKSEPKQTPKKSKKHKK